MPCTPIHFLMKVVLPISERVKSTNFDAIFSTNFGHYYYDFINITAPFWKKTKNTTKKSNSLAL